MAEPGDLSSTGANGATTATAPSVDAIADLGVAEIVAAVRSGALDPVDVLRAYVAAIDARNPGLNAVVTLGLEAAVARASALWSTAAGEGPLAGVPFTVKDSIETAGMLTTSGVGQLAEHVPATDAPAVRMLRDAGGVLLGKTNVPPLAGDFVTTNRLFGRTSNPWSARRSPAGSSGGGAAAVAAGLTGFDLGSDTAGSLIVPAHHCGVVAHRPTRGHVPSGGHIPPLPGSRVARELTTLGVLARSVADAALVTSILLGRSTIVDAPTIEGGPLTIGLWTDDPVCPVSAAVRAGIERAVDGLRALGHRTVTIEPPADLVTLARCCARLVGSSSADVLSTLSYLGYQRRVATGRPLLDFDVSWEIATGAAASHRAWLRLREEQAELAELVDGAFERVDVLICPPAPTPAFEHPPGRRSRRTLVVDGEVRPFGDHLVWPSISTVSGCPVTVVPTAVIEGLPVGVQVIGRRGDDERTLGLAADLGRQLGIDRLRPPLTPVGGRLAGVGTGGERVGVAP